MNDREFLTLQIKYKILSAEGNEYQSFFENVMLSFYDDFKRITPNGNQGDGGNDGFRESTGQYYQVYSPKTAFSQKKAVKKYKDDFVKLKRNWGDFASIKEYIFVYNDKFHGITEELLRTTSEMAKQYPNYKFDILSSDNLEKLVKNLSSEKLVELGFTVDARESVKVISMYLEMVDVCLDEENTELSKKLLNFIETLVSNISEVAMIIAYKLLKAKYLRKIEKIEDAKEILLEVLNLEAECTEAKLILAEIYWQEGNLVEFRKLQDEFVTYKPHIELYKVYELLFKINQRNEIEVVLLNEDNFPNDKNIKSNLYRLAAIALWENGDTDKAKEYINKSLLLNPDRFSTHILSLGINVESLRNKAITKEEKEKLINVVKSIESRFYNGCSERGKILLESKKLLLYSIFEKFEELYQSAKYIIQNIDKLYFDKAVESIIQQVLSLVAIPEKDFENLTLYIYNSNKRISVELQRVIFSHIIASNFLLKLDNKTIGIIDDPKITDLLNNWGNKKDEAIYDLVKDEIELAHILASSLKDRFNLRQKLIKRLEKKKTDISRLKFLLSIDKGDINEAQAIFMSLDKAQLSVVDLQNIYSQIRAYNSPSFNSIVLLELIDRLPKNTTQLQYKVHLFFANSLLKKHLDLIELGNEILDFHEQHLISLDQDMINAIIINTSLAYFERIKVESEIIESFDKFLKNYSKLANTFEFLIGVLAEFYILKKEYDKAIDEIVEAVKIKRNLSHTDYAKLYVVFIKIDESSRLSDKSLNKIVDNTFILLSDNEWYYLGSGNSLDAITVENNSERSNILKGVKLNHEIDFSTEFTKANPLKVLKIYKIEQYIITRVVTSFQQLAHKSLLEGVWVIDMKGKDNNIDVNNLQNFLKKQDEKKEPFFSLYLKNNIPLSFLAINEGGLTNAIGKVSTTSRGYIHIASGSKDEMDMQLSNARDVIDQKSPFVIDGLSALFLTESGLLMQVLQTTKNFFIPRSVIEFLIQTSEKFKPTEKSVGYMYYSNDKMVFRERNSEQDALLWKKFNDVIKYLESDATHIIETVSIQKSDVYVEQKFPSEIVDPFIISQSRKMLLLTDDYLYLSVNKLQTKKESPSYFSSFALIKALKEKGLVDNSVYLAYFAYLSNYRCKFLPIDIKEILEAVINGDGIKTININNLMKFNLGLTLSEEYGVNPEQSLKLTAFLINTLIFDESIPKENLREIFINIMNIYPTRSSKKSIAKFILYICRKILSTKINKSLILLPMKPFSDRIEFLESSIDLSIVDTNIVFPANFSV